MWVGVECDYIETVGMYSGSFELEFGANEPTLCWSRIMQYSQPSNRCPRRRLTRRCLDEPGPDIPPAILADALETR